MFFFPGANRWRGPYNVIGMVCVQYGGGPLGAIPSTSNHQQHVLQYVVGSSAVYVTIFITDFKSFSIFSFFRAGEVHGRIGCRGCGRGRCFAIWLSGSDPRYFAIRNLGSCKKRTRLMEYSESCPKVEIENFHQIRENTIGDLTTARLLFLCNFSFTTAQQFLKTD